MAPDYYQYLYLTVVVVFTGWVSWRYSKTQSSDLGTEISRSNVSQSHRLTVSLPLALFFIIFIGLRPISIIYADMPEYDRIYNLHLGEPFSFHTNTRYLIYDNISHLFASLGFSSHVLFLFIAFIYFGGIFLACWKLFPNNTLYTFVIYLGTFSTFAYATNTMKAGMAASMFLCAIAYWRKWLPCIIFLLLSLGFHHSMILPVVGFGLVYLYRKPKAYLIFWLICLIIAAFNIRIFQYGFSLISNDQANLYLNNEGWGFISGFRFDFVLYSAAPLLLGIYVMYKKGYKSDRYNFIYCLYTFVNAIWLLCMYANFTNRIAYLSWFMMPFVLVFPFFDYNFEKNLKRDLNLVAWGNLSFTLVMTFIYYGILGK